MKVITLLNPKGGVGKSTVAINLARGLQLQGHYVLLIDTDIDQTSCSLWREDSPVDFFTVIQSRPDRISKALATHPNYDWVIIDGAGKVDLSLVKIIQNSDLVIIPVQPSAFDLWASMTILDTVDALKGAPPVSFLISRAKKGTKIKASLIATLIGLDKPILNSTIHEKVDYPESIAEGKTIYERNEAGAAEFNALINQIEEII